MAEREDLQTPLEWQIKRCEQEDCFAQRKPPANGQILKLDSNLSAEKWFADLTKILRAAHAGQEEPLKAFQFRSGWKWDESWVEIRIRTASGETKAVYFRLDSLRDNPHVWLGFEKLGSEPVLLSTRLLEEHVHIMGSSGSGKTTKGLIPLIEQLVQLRRPNRKQRGGVEYCSGMVIIDLKGDMALFSAAKDAAEKAGKTFKWFTTEVGRSTYAFNPFLKTDSEKVTLAQTADRLIEALGLDHGEQYGASYFTRVNRRVLQRHMRRREALPQSLLELATTLTPEQLTRENRDSYELGAALELLAQIDQLNVTPNSRYAAAAKSSIKMDEVVAQKQVAYFCLPQAIEGASAREIGRLVINSLHRSCFNYHRETGEKANVYLVIDEFQNVVGKSFTHVLEQGRSIGLSAILAHQHLGQLNKGRDQDYRDVVKGARFKQFFSVDLGSDTHEYVMRASGLELMKMIGFSQQSGAGSGLGTTTGQMSGFNSQGPSGSVTDLQVRNTLRNSTAGIGIQEIITERFGPNELIKISDDVKLSIVHFRSGHGFSHFRGYPFVMSSNFHIERATHEARMAKGWPQGNAETMVCTPRSVLFLDAESSAVISATATGKQRTVSKNAKAHANRKAGKEEAARQRVFQELEQTRRAAEADSD
jgi:hypothetical protein